MARHTPGPWGCFYTSNHAHDYRLTRLDGSILPVNAPANDHAEQRANARLIAAAPDMAALLEEVADQNPVLAGPTWRARIIKARVLAAKVNGGANA